MRVLMQTGTPMALAPFINTETHTDTHRHAQAHTGTHTHIHINTHSTQSGIAMQISGGLSNRAFRQTHKASAVHATRPRLLLPPAASSAASNINTDAQTVVQIPESKEAAVSVVFAYLVRI